MPGADPAAVGNTLPLRDIHLPPAPGWWPPAPGWWLLAVLFVALTLALVLLWRRRRRLRYRRQALRQLAELEIDFHLAPTALLAALSTLLRRALLSAFGDQICAGLAGDDWLQLLDQGFADAPFATGAGRALGHGPYQPQCAFDRAALLALSRRRLKTLPPASPQRGPA